MENIYMRDHLLDIVQNIYSLGIIDLVKVSGTADETKIDAIAEDRTVIVQGQFKNPVPEFIGTFGMPNLGKLKTILGIPEYSEDAELVITKKADEPEQPSGIHFENKTGDFKNDYRFMVANVVNDKLKSIKFKGVKWNVEFHPTAASIQRLKFQASANSEETTFTAKTDGTDLKFYFGDHSSHAGNFVFQGGVSGTLTKAWSWPVATIISILSLAGDKTMRISDEGAAQITIDTGIAEYNFIIPAQSK